MKKFTTPFVASLACFGLVQVAGAASLNEAVFNDISTDTHEFIEVCGAPGENLNGLTLVVIESDKTAGGQEGTIDVAISLTGQTVPASGRFTVGNAAVSPNIVVGANTLENGAGTLLLVSGFTGAVGMDIDTNNDCLADGSIGTIVDGVALFASSSTTAPGPDCTAYYGVPQLGPDTGTGGTSTFDVAGVARCEECTGDWGMICLDGTEPTGPGCDVNNAFNPYFVQFASPGAGNTCPPVSVEESSWGFIKGQYR